MLDFLVLILLAVLGFLAHVARKQRWLEYVLRGLIVIFALLQGLLVFSISADLLLSPWVSFVLNVALVCALIFLFQPMRRGLSWVLTALNLLITGQAFLPLIRRKLKPLEYFAQNKIFVPTSFPHLMALFIYINTAGYLLICIDPEGFKMPYMPLPIPLMVGQLLSYNGIGLIILSFAGVGYYITRSYKEVLARLALVKPNKVQVGIGIALIFISFTYDALWAIFTHHLGGQDLATKLSFYNSGTFSVAGGFVPSVILALATALCAGIGEETLIRGALQPVFGILPSALLHGMLHGQFAHAPIFILQVAIWSTIMGLVKRYTNTTTTIIGHAGFNFVTTFLFAFNP